MVRYIYIYVDWAIMCFKGVLGFKYRSLRFSEMQCNREPIRFMVGNDIRGILVKYTLIFPEEYAYVLNFGYSAVARIKTRFWYSSIKSHFHRNYSKIIKYKFILTS